MRTFLMLLASFVLAQPVLAQEMPADYATVLKTLGRQGDYKDGVLRVNIPRNWGRGPADKLATSVRAALDQTSRKSSPRR